MAASDETPKQAPTDPTDPNNGWESIIYQENNSTSGTRDAKDGVSATTQCYVHPKQTVQTATPTVCNNEQHSSLLRRAESDRARSSSVRNAVSNGTAMVSPINGFPQAESSDQLLLRLESQIRRVLHQQPTMARNIDRLRRTNFAMHSHIEELVGIIAMLKHENAQLRALLRQQQQEQQAMPMQQCYEGTMVNTPPLCQTADDLFGNLPLPDMMTPSSTIGPLYGDVRGGL